MEKCPTKTKDWCGVMQNFTKVANMKNPKLQNNTTIFPHALKDILKTDKKPRVYAEIRNPLARNEID